MAKPKYYLDSPNANDEHPVLIKYSFNGLRLKYYTAISIKKSHFQTNCNKGNAKPIKSTAPFAEQYNNKLLDIAASAITIVNEAKGDDISIKFVREQLDSIYKPKKAVIEVKEEIADLSFLSFFEKIIEDSKSGKRLISTGKNRGKRYSANTIKNYNSTLAAIIRYKNHEKLKNIDITDITPDFYDSFRSFCYDIEDKEVSTFAGYIKDIKTLMIESKSPDFDANHFYMPDYESDTIAFNIEQIDMIHNLDLSDSKKYVTHMVIARDSNKKVLLDNKGNKILKSEKIFYPVLDNIRNLALIGCYSAMRFQNFNDLNLEEVGDNFIRIKQIKTGARTTIPIMNRLRSILDKNNGELPVSVSNQQFNRVFKHIVKLAGLDHIIRIKNTKGNKENYIEKHFYELVGSHTARRSYATIMFKAGVPPLLIMSATGHTTEKSFLRYIRATNEDKAKLLSEQIKKIGL